MKKCFYDRPRLAYVQSISIDLYIDCKTRSKKSHGLPIDKENPTDDERLIHFILENTSLTDSNRDSERCFHENSRLIYRVCKMLCPGEWCSRCHCKSFSSHCAYNCAAGKRPAICKTYKEYLAKKNERLHKYAVGDTIVSVHNSEITYVVIGEATNELNRLDYVCENTSTGKIYHMDAEKVNRNFQKVQHGAE